MCVGCQTCALVSVNNIRTSVRNAYKVSYDLNIDMNDVDAIIALAYAFGKLKFLLLFFAVFKNLLATY